MSTPQIIKARTILLDWFDLDGNYIGDGYYITTCQSIEDISDELFYLASKGKRPGLPTIKPDGLEEFTAIVTIRPLAHALGMQPHETLKVPFDPIIPYRLLDLIKYSLLEAISRNFTHGAHEKTISTTN